MPRGSKGRHDPDVIFIRLSALGDVAMTLPFVYEICRQNPSGRFLFVTTPFPSKLFIDKPANLRTVVFRKKEDRTIPFALRLHKMARRAEVVDLHAVPRTRWITLVLRLLGHHVTTLDKPREARRRLLGRRFEPEVPRSLYVPRMTQLYRETLGRARFPYDGEAKSLGKAETEKKIGLALFARHEGKMLLPTQEEELVALLSQNFPDFEIMLYGANETYELERRRELATPYSNVLVASHATFEDEMHEISSLACMVSMDSANQHIARFLGVPVVSLWMQTHPAAGFLPFGMTEEDCIGTDLECRPCSVYGNKPCRRRDWACKHRLDLGSVIERIKAVSEG